MKTASRILLVTLALAASPLRAATSEPMVYRVELASGATLTARTPPVPQGTRLVFARHPDGALVSLKRSEVLRVVSVPLAKMAAPAVAHTVRPGTLIMLGPTGGGAGATASTLLNPARDYRPEWDGRQVPGQNLAFPASAGDYREGMTFAYPPGTAVQSAPGQPPTGVPSGEPPKSPQD